MTERPLALAMPLVEAVRAIEASRRRIALVADADGRLAGTLTDGDVRRCLLAGGTLQTPVEQAMNASPIVAPAGSADAYILDLMRRGNVLAVPVIDAAGRVERVVHITDLAPVAAPGAAGDGYDFAVVMAGGDGARLRPLTDTVPKPMLDVGGVPLLERQIERLAAAGVHRVYISVNYLSHVIESHFGDGERFGVDVRYLREREKLGTAGALRLLPETPQRPILVMNGDILTTFDIGSLHAYHLDHAADVTVAAVDYHINIPYGVIRADGAQVTGIAEKPSQRFLCNAGVYAVSPAVLDLVPNRHSNMTDLIAQCVEAGRRVAVFPVHEFWSDIGTPDDLERARAFFTPSSS